MHHILSELYFGFPLLTTAGISIDTPVKGMTRPMTAILQRVSALSVFIFKICFFFFKVSLQSCPLLQSIEILRVEDPLKQVHLKWYFAVVSP